MIDQLIESLIQHDVVELPTQGLYYPDKRKSLRVAYLNASDENILASANLIQNNGIIDALLKRKILDKDFNVDEMAEDDKRAVLLFLRNTGLGPEYNVRVWDQKTDEYFPVTLDLTEAVKFKEFTLTPDANGEFDHVLPKTGAKIKFKFLTPKQEEDLRKFETAYKGPGEPPIVTKQLEYMIKEVDGERDQMKIYQFIQVMPLKDSQNLREYVKQHKPGLDCITEVRTPSGGTAKVEVTFGVEFFRPFYGL